MNCKSIQELILTDYLDDELDIQQKKVIDGHLASCVHCQEFLAVAKETSVDPLSQSQKISLSEEKIWQNIKQQIDVNPSPKEESVLSNIFSRITDLLVLPQPILVTTGFVVLILTMMLSFEFMKKSELAKKIAMEKRQELVAYIFSEFSVNKSDDDAGYGTAIEEYFL